MKGHNFAWGCFISGCFASVATLISSECGSVVTIAVFLAGSLGTALIFGGRWLYKHTFYQDDNFKLTLYDRLPNDSLLPGTPVPAGVEILPIQQTTLYVEVKATRGFPMKSINFRCIALRDIGHPPVSSPVQVVSLNDHENAPIIRTNRDDNYNGIDLEYAEVRGLGKNGCLYFEIVLDPRREWEGTLSFKGRDPYGFCSYGRYPLEIKTDALQPTRLGAMPGDRI